MLAVDISLTDEFASLLESIDEETCHTYEQHTDMLLSYVNQTMDQRDDLAELIGGNPVEMMHINHANHIRFMLSVFQMHHAQNLVQTIIWAYQAYTGQGFASRYFPIVLTAWQKAVALHLNERSAAQINALYQHIIDNHQTFMALAHLTEAPLQMMNHMRHHFEQLLAALLKPDLGEAIKVAGEYIREPQDIPQYWEQVIQPAMYDIGRLWAEGKITVGQEHLATSIAQRVISVYYPMILNASRDKGAIIVTISPGEMHEIGPRILSDILEMNGWDVHYTGINVPIDSLINLVRQLKARFLCISTTLSFNLPFVSDVIKHIRAEQFEQPLYIVVGGQAYRHDLDAWRQVGADSFAFSASELVEHLEVYHTSSYLPTSSLPPEMPVEAAPVDMEVYLLQEITPSIHINSGMQALMDMAIEHGKEVLFVHSKSLVALLQPNGDIVECNDNLKQLSERWAETINLHALLVSSSRPHLQRMIQIARQKDVPMQSTLHFGASQIEWPASYECYIIPVPHEQVILYANPSPPLDERAALEYLHITNELASTTRELQKTRHKLMTKQQALEEAFTRIERFAYIDELTQLLNRRSILARLAEEIERTLRYETHLSVFILDVDYFKQVNDTYGHQVGDLILQLIAQKQADALRRADLLGRYGGEEFLAVLPGVDLESALHIANRLRKQVAAAEFVVTPHETIHRTVSIGIARFAPYEDTMESLLAHADSALYRAKERGRNQVCVWEESEANHHQATVSAGE